MLTLKDNLRNIIYSFDFLIGTFFLLVIILLFSLEGITLSLGRFIFGLLLTIVLAGFFLYIYTPKVFDLGKTLLIRREYCIFPPICVSIIFIMTKITFSDSINFNTFLFQCIFGIIFICTPTLFYLVFPPHNEKRLTWVDIICGLWVWLPIEGGIVDNFIGSINLGEIPLESLLGAFAFLYALLFVRSHEMGLSFTISYDDFLIVNKVNIFLILVIIPLGMVTYFLAPPDIIWNNFLDLLENIPSSILEIMMTFILIFLAIALIEGMFFRGFIFKLLSLRFESETTTEKWWYGGVIIVIFIIIITPWIDNFFWALSQPFPVFSPLYDITESMAKPLGEEEGRIWPLVKDIPLEILYLTIALVLGMIAIIIIHQTREPLIAALVISSILFGWAHFEDVRYIFFATIAGFGYGWTYHKTEKVVPAALVHTVVDAVWSLLLSF